MGEILLSTIVGDRDLADSFEVAPVKATPEYSTATPAKTRVAVPEHCKGFELPSNINQFITDMYPNMRAYVFSRLRDEDDTAEVINNFVLYMLSPAPTRDNVAHWKLYDPQKWSKQPYYKYFLIQLRFFQQNRQREIYKQSKNFTLSETDYESTAENQSNRALNLDTMEVNLDAISYEPAETAYEMVFLGQIDKYLSKMSEQHQDSFCFEAKAQWLFHARLNELPNADIAYQLNISPSAVSQWMTKLKKILNVFVEGEVPEDYHQVVSR